MTRPKVLSFVGALFLALQFFYSAPNARATTAMIFCDGTMGSAAGLTTAQINGLRASGFTTMILFTMSVSANGDFTYNGGVLICSNGVYVGPSNWGSLLNQCRATPTTIKRIEMCIGGWGDVSWTNIKNLIAANGTNSTTVLYKNLVALKSALGVDAIDSDDESAYDSGSAIKFGRMCGSVGLKFTLCPYTNPNYWQAVYNGVGTNCDQVYLQCYDGGGGNNPASWNSYFSGLKVIAGYWDSERTSIFYTNMVNWSSAGGDGGFLWPSCSGCTPPAGPSEMSQYAGWILSAFYRFQPLVTPANGFAAVAAFNSLVLPMSTTFSLTNGTASSFVWSLSNTSAWLNVSSSAGVLAAGAATTVTVSLKTDVATNLAVGNYTANIVFTNQTTGGVPLNRVFTLNTTIANWPLKVSGWNAGIIASNNATGATPGATGFDLPNNYSFYQQGLSIATRGMPLTGTFTSLSDNRTAFSFGPYGAMNALMLGDTYPKSGTLTFSSPQSLNTIAILAASANGGGQGTFYLTFVGGSKSPVYVFNCQDWFYVVTNVALQGFGRLKLGSTLTAEDNGDTNPNLYQTTINLAAQGFTLPVASITFSNPTGAGGTQTTAILAVSGMPATAPLLPPGGLVAVAGTNATVQLSWDFAPGATNYNIRQATTGNGSYLLAGSTTGTNFTVGQLANGNVYYFVASSQGTLSESTNSNPVSAMPGSYLGWAFGLNPVAYWPLNETVGPVAYDLVGGNNGTYGGSLVLTTGGAVGAGFGTPHRIAIYNGASSYTQIPRVIGDTNFTIVFWVRTGTTGGTPNWYNGKGLVDGEVGGTQNDFGVALVGGKVGFGVGNPDTTLTSIKSINDNLWHQVIATRDAGSGLMSLFIDGAFDSSTTGPAGSRTTPTSLRIGSLQTGGNFFSGSMSDVTMYAQTLTAAQAATLYSAATGIFYDVTLTNRVSNGSLVLSWPGNGKLLEATNVAGPWSTNASLSPMTVVPNQPQKFYRIQTR